MGYSASKYWHSEGTACFYLASQSGDWFTAVQRGEARYHQWVDVMTVSRQIQNRPVARTSNPILFAQFPMATYVRYRFRELAISQRCGPNQLIAKRLIGFPLKF